MISFVIGMIAGGTITTFFLCGFRITEEDRIVEEPTMEEFMQGQDLGDPEDGRL